MFDLPALPTKTKKSKNLNFNPKPIIAHVQKRQTFSDVTFVYQADTCMDRQTARESRAPSSTKKRASKGSNRENRFQTLSSRNISVWQEKENCILYIDLLFDSNGMV